MCRPPTLYRLKIIQFSYPQVSGKINGEAKKFNEMKFSSRAQRLEKIKNEKGKKFKEIWNSGQDQPHL